MTSNDFDDVRLARWYLADIGMPEGVASVWLLDYMLHPRRWARLIQCARERKEREL